MRRDTLTYIFLGLIALILMFVTISLQTSIRATQSPAATEDSPGFLTMLRQQAGEWILPSTASAPVATVTTVTVGGSDSTQDIIAEGEVVDSTASEDSTSVLSPSTTVVELAESQLVADNSAARTALFESVENLTVSEDREILASIIGREPNAVGFFGYDDYLRHQDTLRAVSIRLPDGEVAAPNAATVAAGLYPLAHPLYLYTSPTIIREKPAVEALLACFLNRLPDVVGNSGYLLPSRTLFAQAIQSFDATCQRCRREASSTHPVAEIVPACDFADVPVADLSVVGSTTLAPLTARVADLIRATDFEGEITVAATSTGEGFRSFCDDSTGDIVNASRTVAADERERCRSTNRSVLPFPVAVDALTIVVNPNNTFLQNATIQELQQIFVYARLWSEVNPQWPTEEIIRALPSQQSGLFDYFVEAVIEEQALATLADQQATPLSYLNDGAAATVSTTSDTSGGDARTIAGTVIGTEVFVNNDPLVRIGYVEANAERGAECAIVTDYMALILEGNFGLQVERRAFTEASELFATLAAKDPAERIDLTFCYLDPLDRQYRQRYFSYTEFIDSGYRQVNDNRFVIMTNSLVKPALERENRCLYQFLDALNLETVDLSGQPAMAWYMENQATITSWLPCES